MDLNQLLELPAEFLCAPAAVSEVFLCGVRPVERDRDWPLEVWYSTCMHICMYTFFKKIQFSYKGSVCSYCPTLNGWLYYLYYIIIYIVVLLWGVSVNCSNSI